MGGVPQIGYPNWMVYVKMENLTNMDDLGYLYFRKPPYGKIIGFDPYHPHPLRDLLDPVDPVPLPVH